MTKKLAKTNKMINSAIEFAENYKRVSKDMDKLSYARPNIMKYLYFMEKDETQELESDAMSDLLKLKEINSRKRTSTSSKIRKLIKAKC